MQQDSVTPEGATPLGQIDQALMVAHAAREIQERAPAEIWADLDTRTRRQWLRLASWQMGWSPHAWDALPPDVQRALRDAIRQIMGFLGQAGIDLFGR